MARQLTPLGSGCSVQFGKGVSTEITKRLPGRVDVDGLAELLRGVRR